VSNRRSATSARHDIVIGDDDGVVAFAPTRLPAVLAAATAQLAKEAAIMASIENGTYRSAYGAHPHPPDASR
jgi:regulator of RNase E activity RraA